MLIFMFIALMSSFNLMNAKQDLYTVYAHGIVDNGSQIQRFSDAIITDSKYTKSVNFTDTHKETGYGINRIICEITTYFKKPVNRSKMYMGQGKDIVTLDQEIQHVPANSNIILYGCSRGSAAIIKYLAKYNPHNVAAIILDASPTSMPATLHPMLAKAGICSSYDASIFSALFPAYPINSITPLQAIKHITNKQLPILLVHSQDDHRVPFAHALKLYTEFKQQGFNNVYLVRIPQGKHSFLLQDQYVKDFYLTAIHSFYKKYKLPYNPLYAQNDMTQYQQDIDSIKEEIAQFEHDLKNQYEYSKLRNLIIAGISITALLTCIYYKKS